MQTPRFTSRILGRNIALDIMDTAKDESSARNQVRNAAADFPLSLKGRPLVLQL